MSEPADRRRSKAPADQIVLGVIGSGGRGTFVMTIFQKNAEVRVGAIRDVYEPNLEVTIDYPNGKLIREGMELGLTNR